MVAKDKRKPRMMIVEYSNSLNGVVVGPAHPAALRRTGKARVQGNV